MDLYENRDWMDDFEKLCHWIHRKEGHGIPEEESLYQCDECGYVTGYNVPNSACPFCKNNSFTRRHICVLLYGDPDNVLCICKKCGWTQVLHKKKDKDGRLCMACFNRILEEKDDGVGTSIDEED